MFHHTDLTDPTLRALIKSRQITMAGNARLKIYGHLGCPSGKRMLRANRVFFSTESEAIASGYRPCATCLRSEYRRWKQTQIR